MGSNMKVKEDILNTIKNHKKDIQRFGVKNVGLHGSCIWEKQTPESDIDLLIELDSE